MNRAKKINFFIKLLDIIIKIKLKIILIYIILKIK